MQDVFFRNAAFGMDNESLLNLILELELELELIQSHMTQEPMLRGEVGACRIKQLTSTAKNREVLRKRILRRYMYKKCTDYGRGAFDGACGVCGVRVAS